MVVVRRAEKKDSAGYLDMRRQLWPDCTADRHELEIDLILASSGLVLLAEASTGDLVGFAEISIRNDHVEGTAATPVPYLEGWFVKPEHQGKGIGKALIEAAEDHARNLGYRELASDAELANELSIAVHRKIGFREVGRSVHFVKTLG